MSMHRNWIAGVALAGALAGGRVGAAEYFVDRNHAQAGDQNPGTEAQPFKTIQAAVDKAQPGDKLWVKAGDYEEPVTIRTPATPGRPIVLSAWQDDRVRIGYRPRPLPVAGAWQPVEGSKSWQIQLTNDVPEDMLGILNGKPVVTFMQDTPVKDDLVNRAAYRKASRTLMVNANGKDPGTLGRWEYGRRPGIATRFSFFIIDEPSAWWVVRKLEFSWQGCGMYLFGDHCIVEDCFFTHCYRGGLFLHGRMATIRRCNFYQSGGGIGSSGAGTAHILEDNLIVECGESAEEDIIIVDIPTAMVEGSGPTVFKGNNLAMQFNYNIVAENPSAGWYADCANVQSCRLLGNAFWDNPGGGIYNEALVHDTLTQGNVFYRNGISSSVATRWNVIDNLFVAGGVIWHNLDINPVRDGFMLLRGNAFVNPGYGYLSDFAAGWQQTAFPETFRGCMVDRNRIWAAPGAVLINDGGEGRKYTSLDEIRKEFGWELHGEVRPYTSNSLDEVVAAMGGSFVTFRIPWGKHSAEARPMLANAGGYTRWPGAPVSADAGSVPNFFWRVADGDHNPAPLWGDYATFVYHEWWGPCSCIGELGERLGCRWYVDADPTYPTNFLEKTPCRTGLLDKWSMRTAYGSGNFWLVTEGLHPDQMLPPGVGYWSPLLGAAPGAQVTVALKLRGTDLVSTDKGSPVVWLEFTDECGQHRQRAFLLGRDEAGQEHRPDLLRGSYGWTNLSETVTAPSNAVRMALFFGLRPCTGKAEFDDINLRTADAAAPAAAADVVGPRLPLPRIKESFAIDLAAVVNHGLADEVGQDGRGGWDDQGPAADMHLVATGPRRIGGVPFTILAGPTNAVILNFPKAGEPKKLVIPVGRTADDLFFLHGVAGYGEAPEFFRYVVRYADGKEIPILVGPVNMAGWIAPPVARFPLEEGTFSTVAETVTVPKYGTGSLYRMEWGAPLDRRPVVIKEIEFSVTGGAVPALVGLTGVIEW